MMLQNRLRYALVVSFALFAILVGCSDDETGPTGVGGTTVSPLTSDYWPLDEGATWTYARVETGVFSPDPNVSFFNDSLPSAHRRIEISGTGEINGQSGRVLRNLLSREANGEGHVWVDNEILFRENGNAIEVLGESPVDSIADNGNFIYNDVIADQGAYSWIEFGTLHWEKVIASYSADSIADFNFIVPVTEEVLPVQYGELGQGRQILQWALGFDYTRNIYPTEELLNITDILVDEYTSDIDHDLYPDGIASVSIAGDVIGETDFAYSDLGALTDSLFPQLEDVVYEDCKLVRFSLLIDLMRTNHRFPNAGPGQTAIDYPFNPENVIIEVARRDIGLMLLAPGLGPVMITTSIDLDKLIKAGNPVEPMTLFQPDLNKIDYLVDSSLID